MKKIVATLTFLLCVSPLIAETTKTIFNPFTGKLDYITKLSSSTLPPGSTNYIQNRNSLQSGTTFYVSSGTVNGNFYVGNHMRMGTKEFGTFQNVGVGYPSLSIYTTGGDALSVGNANGWVELGIEAVALEMGLITENDEFLAVKDSFPNGGYTYGNGGLKVSYGTGVGDGDTMLGNGTAKPGIKFFSWGTGNGGGATAGQIGWGDKTNGVQLGLLSDLGNGYSGAFYLLGDSLQAPFGEMAEFDVLDRQLQPSDARVAFTVGRIDSNVGGFRYDIGIRNAANAIYIPFGITPSGVYIDNNGGVDGIDGSAFLTLGQGVGAAGGAPLKILAGTALMATPEQGAFETDPNGTLYYDRDALTRGQFAFIDLSQSWTASQTFTTAVISSATIQISTGSIARVGGSLFDNFTSTGNTTTVETNLYVNTVPSKTLNNNGDKIIVHYAGTHTGSTSSKEERIYVGTTTILDTGAVAISANNNWDANMLCTRISSSGIRCTAAITDSGSIAISNSPTYTQVGGLNFNGPTIVKITAQASGVGAASNDTIATLGSVIWMPSGQN